MAAKVAVAGSKGGRRRMLTLLCLFTVQLLTLGLLARCGDGEWVMAPGGAAAFAPAN